MTTETTPDWAAARSDKWRRQLAGLEAMLAPLDEPLMATLGFGISNRPTTTPTSADGSPLYIADIGCGAGATTLEVFRQAPPGSVVHGFDLSPALIEVARRRQREHGPHLAFEVADMQTAGPPGRRYDMLVSRLGVMFFADARAAFVNLRRWLVPGGRFAFAVWGPVDDNPWMTATRAAVAEVIELAPIPPSGPGPFRYEDAEAFTALLTEAGFGHITVTDFRRALPIGHKLDAVDAAHFALAAFSSFAERLASAGGDAFTTARRALTERFQDFEREGAVLAPARIHIVAGQAL